MKTTALLLLLLAPIAADYLTGLPSDTTYAEMMVEIDKIYNKASCKGVYRTNYTDFTENNLVSVYNEIECNGQTFTIYGKGNGLFVKFPVQENNYAGVDLESVTACGKAGGCLELLYVGTNPPTAVACNAYTKLSEGAPVTNCKNCTVCTLDPIVKVTILCDNANSEYTTPGECMVPFTSNGTFMGVSGTDGGSGGSGATTSASSHWSVTSSMVIVGLMSAASFWM